MNESQLCLCQSGKKYIECCGPFILRKKFPQSAIQLMRSRYTAFNIGDFNYIKATCAQDAKVLFEAHPNTEKLNGVRLDVLSVLDNDEDAEIVFKAYYEKQGRIFYLHEHSFFKKIDNHWKYIKGEQLG